MAIRKGTELNNVNETWRQNEQTRGNDNDTGTTGATATVSNDLEQTIKDEAAEYDRANTEDRLPGGERASVSDDGGNGSDE